MKAIVIFGSLALALVAGCAAETEAIDGDSQALTAAHSDKAPITCSFAGRSFVLSRASLALRSPVVDITGFPDGMGHSDKQIDTETQHSVDEGITREGAFSYRRLDNGDAEQITVYAASASGEWVVLDYHRPFTDDADALSITVKVGRTSPVTIHDSGTPSRPLCTLSR